MAQMNPYVHFNGTCREAMNFYYAALGGELYLQSIGESPIAAHMPAEMHNNIIHGELHAGNYTLMASDMMDARGIQYSNGVKLCLVCTSPEEIESIFNKLAEGGTITRELKAEFFGTFGDLTDKFGVQWMFAYSPQPA